MNTTTSSELPDPFLFQNGERVRAGAEWGRRRKEMLDDLLEIEYGAMPPAPKETRGEILHTSTLGRMDGARFISCRVVAEGERPFAFLLTLLVPPGDGPFPVVLTGDACWKYVTDAITADVLRRGFVLAQFNRVEIAADEDGVKNASGLNRIYPGHGALAYWAWGYHRCVDVLAGLKFVDAARIAAVGHSRGGKTTLLAGATDERIALTWDNASGAGGSASYRWLGPGAEKLVDLTRFPSWFGPRYKEFAGRENELPFDQHFLTALIAPRPLLITGGLGDLWANPQGTMQVRRATAEVYRFFEAEERLGIAFREGGHEHNAEDWAAFMDFAEWQLQGKERARRFDENPFPELGAAFSWSAPV